MRQAALGGRLAITASSVLSTALILNPVVTAQERFGNFMGTVTDASGAVLSGVAVTLTNKDTNRVFTTKLNALHGWPQLSLEQDDRRCCHLRS